MAHGCATAAVASHGIGEKLRNFRCAPPSSESSARRATQPGSAHGVTHNSTGAPLLYVERWLKAPLQLEDGSLVERDRGTPQGSAISPLLANMFLHYYAFDAWVAKSVGSSCSSATPTT